MTSPTSDGPMTVQALMARRDSLANGILQGIDHAQALRAEADNVERNVTATRGALAECERLLRELETSAEADTVAFRKEGTDAD